MKDTDLQRYAASGTPTEQQLAKLALQLKYGNRELVALIVRTGYSLSIQQDWIP